MDAQEKAKLLADLENGRRVLLDAAHDVPEDIAARAPAPGRWSVLECVEHVAVSEDYLFGQITAAHHSDTPLFNPEREARIVAVGLDRSRTIQAPEVGKPTGRFTTLAGALGRFESARERTIDFVSTCQEDLRCKITSHPLIGSVNCYETLLMIAAHPFRHAKQIEEIKAALKN